ncbi:MAG: hypothetical protein AAGA99_05620 [Actinomycetota bacterium]
MLTSVVRVAASASLPTIDLARISTGTVQGGELEPVARPVLGPHVLVGQERCIGDHQLVDGQIDAAHPAAQRVAVHPSTQLRGRVGEAGRHGARAAPRQDGHADDGDDQEHEDDHDLHGQIIAAPAVDCRAVGEPMGLRRSGRRPNLPLTSATAANPAAPPERNSTMKNRIYTSATTLAILAATVSSVAAPAKWF